MTPEEMEEKVKKIKELTFEIGEVIFKKNITLGEAESALNFSWTNLLHVMKVSKEEFRAQCDILIEKYDEEE